MQVTTIEGIVKNGQIQLTEDVKLPECTKVYVVVPNLKSRTAKIMSPHLVNKEDAEEFIKRVEIDDEI